VATVTKGHAVCLETGGETEHLVSHADTKDGSVPLVDGLADPVSRLHDLLRVTGSVGEEEAVKLVSDRVEVKVPWEDGDDCSALDERSDNVGLATKVEDGDAGASAVRVESVCLAGGSLRNEVFERGVPVLVSLRSGLGSLVAHRETAEGRALVTKERGDGASINAGETGNIVPLTPLVKRLDGLVVRVLERDVRDDDTGALDLARLEERDPGHARNRLIGRDTVVADHGGGEDEDLAEVGRVGHRVGVARDRGGEDGLAELGLGGPERVAEEALAGLEVQSGRELGREDMLQERRVGDGGREATASKRADAHVLERRNGRSELSDRNHCGYGRSWVRLGEEVKLGGPTRRWAELKMADTKDKVGKVAAGRDSVSDTSSGEEDFLPGTLLTRQKCVRSKAST
jgi:hypothetical protein